MRLSTCIIHASFIVTSSTFYQLCLYLDKGTLVTSLALSALRSLDRHQRALWSASLPADSHRMGVGGREKKGHGNHWTLSYRVNSAGTISIQTGVSSAAARDLSPGRYQVVYQYPL
ncbi:hypothetical protein RRG08_046873 [Elysia crispata]|uniref:Uncharacterized protein n=1 Tax=Elysia crispata TaxID=231223 RepID=A0AAE1DHL8_9GAST|nr:hypothetical protein RRG08_046873 [Elysia crispata]